jgi:hypothetical protein
MNPMVFAVIESMNDKKTGVEKYYQLVDSQVGAGWGNDEGGRFHESRVFSTKEDVVKSLL